MPHTEENLRKRAVSRRKAQTMNAQSHGDEEISRKIALLIRSEGKTPQQAAGQAFGMARSGDLGPAAKRAAGRRRRK